MSQSEDGCCDRITRGPWRSETHRPWKWTVVPGAGGGVGSEGLIWTEVWFGKMESSGGVGGGEKVNRHVKDFRSLSEQTIFLPMGWRCWVGSLTSARTGFYKVWHRWF